MSYRPSRSARATVSLLACVALTLPACTTPPQQMQKKYASFDVCFKDEKVLATASGAAIGFLLGKAVGGGGKGGLATGAIAGVVGGIIGNRLAWENCLKAFPPRGTTVLVAPPQPVAVSGQRAPAAPQRALAIQSVSAQPLVLGRDLQVTASYNFISDKPGAKDIKAKVSRNVIFTGPDGAQQEIASSTEDVIQQGTSRMNFSIPTPSVKEAPELAQTRDWRFKLVVEAEGMRNEQIISLGQVRTAQASPAGLAPSVAGIVQFAVGERRRAVHEMQAAIPTVRWSVAA